MPEQGLTITLPAPMVERLIAALERLAPVAAGQSDNRTRGQSDGLLTTAEVAERLRKSVRDVQRLVRSGKLRKVSGLGAKTTRFRPVDIEKFLQSPEEREVGRRRL